MCIIDSSELVFTNHALTRAKQRIFDQFKSERELKEYLIKQVSFYNECIRAGSTIYVKVDERKESLYLVVSASDLVVKTITTISGNRLAQIEMGEYEIDFEDELNDGPYDYSELYVAANEYVNSLNQDPKAKDKKSKKK